MRSTVARLRDHALREIAAELRDISEHPSALAGADVAVTLPEAPALPDDIFATLRPSEPGVPLPRTPRAESTSEEGTLGVETDSVLYFEHQHETWRRLLALQMDLVRERCCEQYARGRTEIAVFSGSIPTLREADLWLQRTAGWRVVRAAGYVHPRRFLQFLANRQFPCMDLLRHEDELLYSPEPDMFHDLIGHLPLLCDRSFGEYYETFGRAGTNAKHPEQIEALNRIYWFTMEFGVLDRRPAPLAFGAALLTGLGELLTSGGDAVRREPFSIDAVIASPTDVHKPNEVLYSVSSCDDLLETFVDWARSESLL